MTDKKIALIVTAATVLGVLLIMLSIWTLLRIASSQANGNETLLETSASPGGEIMLEAYRTEPGATVDFSIKVYRIMGKEKQLIYNAYHEDEVSMEWVAVNVVLINEKRLDLSKGETYDWRKN